jgi:pentatricopeptide repeat protein
MSFFYANWFEASCAIILVLVSLARIFCRSHKGSTACSKDLGSQGKDSLSEADKQVRKLIYNLFDKANREASDVFDLYERITNHQAINFRNHIREDNHAQALFISLMTHAIHLKRDDMVAKLMADMRRMDIPRNLCFYASVMKVYASRGQYKEALRMYKYMVQDELRPDGMMYICLMNDAIACNDKEHALHFFRELCKVESPSMRTYMTILRMYAKENDWEKALEILQDIKACGSTPDNLVVNNVLGVCISAGQVEAAEKLLYTFKDCEGILDVISFNTLLKGYAQIPDYHKAEALLDRMQSVGPHPNLISFNTMIDCAVRSMQSLCSSSQDKRKSRQGARDGQDTGIRSSAHFQAMAQKPWDLLDRMEKFGLLPDRYTCSTLIKGMHLSGCSVREIDRALALLKRVGPETLQSKDNDNTRLHEVLFNSMLDACVNARDLTRMAEVFGMMRECQVPVSAVTFGTLIKAFGQAARLDRCEDVWGEMRRAKVVPTAVTYGCYIDACIRNGNMEHAIRVFNEMGPDNCKPNTVIYTSLIRGYARFQQPDAALALYKDMQLRRVECSSLTFNSVLDVVARHIPDPSEMTSVLNDMKAARISPDIVTYSILIKASCTAGNLENAMSLFEQLKREGLVLDEIAFNSLLNGCSKNNKVGYAENVFAAMRELKVRPSNVTFSILVKMYGRAKMLDKAIGILDLMQQEYQEKPNLHVYTCLIQACVQNMQVKRGWDLFHQMQDSGVEPDGVTYGTLIHGCVYGNKFDCAMQLVKRAYGEDTEKHTDRMVPLQPEVVGALRCALSRKSRQEQMDELDALISRHRIQVDSKTRRPTRGNNAQAVGKPQ